jgi:hypothetical protein
VLLEELVYVYARRLKGIYNSEVVPASVNLKPKSHRLSRLESVHEVEEI